MAAPDLLPDAVVRYGDHDLAVVDLHLPPPGTAPTGTLLVLVHGGFWMEEWDRTHTRPLARHLAGLGHLVATPEYRRVGGGGGWPVTAYDVEAAVTALPDLLAGLDLDGGAVRLLLDGAPVTDADPMTLLDGPPGPEVVIVHGDRDVQVPVELSRRFANRHPWARLVELPGVDHFAFLDPRHDAVRVVTDLLDAGQDGAR